MRTKIISEIKQVLDPLNQDWPMNKNSKIKKITRKPCFGHHPFLVAERNPTSDPVCLFVCLSVPKFVPNLFLHHRVGH